MRSNERTYMRTNERTYMRTDKRTYMRTDERTYMWTGERTCMRTHKGKIDRATDRADRQVHGDERTEGIQVEWKGGRTTANK